MSGEKPRRRRLFFALWPDDALRPALGALTRDLPRKQGRFVPLTNLHITLAFAGAVDSKTHTCLTEQAGRIEAGAFRLRLSRIAYLPRSHVLWLGAETSPAALTALVRQLNSALEHCGLRTDCRAYRPHITLARDAAPPVHEAAVAPLDWPVDYFFLVESRTRPDGAHYEVLQRFKLSA